MKRFVLLVGLMVGVSALGSAPVFAQCGVTKACVSIPAGSSAEVISGLVMNSWNLNGFACSATVANGMVVVRISDPVTGRVILWYVLPPFDTTAGPFTATPHALELRANYPPSGTVPRVPFDLYLKVDAGPETLLFNGTTTFGEIQVDVENQASNPSPTTAIPALGTTYRIVLGLSVLAAALWLIIRRSS